MKKTIFMFSLVSIVFSCANSKTTTEMVQTKNDVSKEVNTSTVRESSPQQFIDSSFYVAVNPNPVFIDSTAIIGWPIEYPPYPGEVITPWPPIEIGWWQPFEITYCWFVTDTIDAYKELPVQHMTSHKNCYSFETIDDGLVFSMDVVEPEILECNLQQFGDCFNHLPLNVSWVNTPLLMKKGKKDIHFTYPKYYELELLLKLESTHNAEEIVLIS